MTKAQRTRFSKACHMMTQARMAYFEVLLEVMDEEGTIEYTLGGRKISAQVTGVCSDKVKVYNSQSGKRYWVNASRIL